MTFPKLSVNMSSTTALKLHSLMERSGSNATDITDSAINLLFFFYEETIEKKQWVELHSGKRGRSSEIMTPVDLNINLGPRS